ncbi:Ger(x)C family spore germination protein [Bacillus timonensis]|uniref:Ger(X)C family spore germination protein n=1 Tax=Bacillus timonensis TaxID=1033734 RepID=A0A4S3PN73_9BACI|nr:Ger(x)C family spore germination protein [Bacillus timonensis]THE10575.1 Ger(x)C family spore germination protein [Bacillus timonensis]
MGKWRKIFIFVLVFVCLAGLVGCSRTKIVDKLSIVHVFGFDLGDNDEIIGSALFPEYTHSKSSTKIHYLQEKSDAIALLSPKMGTHTSTPVELAKIRVIVIGNDFAKAGIRDVVDRLLVQPQIATNIQIAVSTHSAEETLKTLKKQSDLTLADQIKQNMTGQLIPRMNLHVFLNHFYGEGEDPYVPMLTIDEEDKVQVDQVGIFKDDKLKLHLNVRETFIFSILEDFRTQANYEVDYDHENRKENIIIQGFRSKKSWEWIKNKQQLNLKLNLIWSITDRPERFDLENPDDIKVIKELIEKNVKNDLKNLLDTLKEKEVDPLGIGNIVRSQDKNWDEKSFYEQYPSLPINVDVHLEIIHSGLQG